MSAIGSVSTAAPPSSTGGLDALTSTEFLDIIFTELTNQDPLAPNDTQALIEQISTIRAVESNEALAANLESILERSEISAASGFIGKIVAGRDQSGLEVDGVVGSVSITDAGPLLNLLGGQRVPFNSVQEVFDPAPFRIPANDGGGNGEGDGESEGADDA